MLCANCNKLLEDNVIFCTYCGVRVADAVTSRQDASEHNDRSFELPLQNAPTYPLFFRTVNNGPRAAVPAPDKSNEAAHVAHE